MAPATKTGARRAPGAEGRARLRRSPPPPTAAGTPLPRVVIAGRQNAGKSTLFNRLLRRRKALVDPTPGVTRDTLEAPVVIEDRPLVLVDTGGFEAEGAHGLEEEVRARSLAAARGAALVVYVLDGKAGLLPADEAAVRALRRLQVPLLFVVNKIDSPGRASGVAEFYALGAADLLAVSAEHGHGIGALAEAIAERIPAVEAGVAAEAVRVSIVGRPNVGKSSLVNRLLGYPRALVRAEAGTTRDAVDTLLEVDGARYLLVDTAGIRRRSRIAARLEHSAVRHAMGSLERSDVALVVLDAGEGLTTQDQRLIMLAWNEGRALVVVANKADLRRERAAALVDELVRGLPLLAQIPIVVTSAVSGAGIDLLLPTVRRVAARHAVTLQTARLNDVVAGAVRAQPPPVVRGGRVRLYYATQVGHRPPEVALFVSDPTAVPQSYQRYLQKAIADAFELTGIPLRLRLRPRRPRRDGPGRPRAEGRPRRPKGPARSGPGGTGAARRPRAGRGATGRPRPR